MSPASITWFSNDSECVPAPRSVEIVPSSVSLPVSNVASAEYQTLKLLKSLAPYVPAVVKSTPASVAFATVTASLN